MCPNEPVLPDGLMPIDRLAYVKDMSVTSLLDAIVAKGSAVSGGDVLLVSHGTIEGLDLNLTKKSQVKLQGRALEALVENASGGLGDFETARILRTTVDALSVLKEKMAKVRALSINRLELRCCLLGDGPRYLDLTRVFFGASSACAPDVLNAIGAFTSKSQPTSNPKVWSAWLKGHPRAIVETLAPGRFAWWRPRAGGLPREWLADTREAAAAWLDTRAPNHKYTKGPIYYECQIIGSDLIFAADSNYRNHLVPVGT
jgi:hypothetical protein